MEMLDTQDLTLFLTYQHVKHLQTKQLGNQIYKLGVSAGLDLEDVNCDFQLKEVIANTNIERKSDCQGFEQHTKELVYSYLKRNGYIHVAEQYAITCNLKQTIINLAHKVTIIYVK